MRGFLLSGSDIDLSSLCEDSPEVVRDAAVLAVRTRKGDWYANLSRGIDVGLLDIPASDAEVRATVESEIAGPSCLGELPGLTLVSVDATRHDARDWSVVVIAQVAETLVTLDTTFTL